MFKRTKKGQSLVEYALIIAVIAAAAILALNLISKNIQTSSQTVGDVLTNTSKVSCGNSGGSWNTATEKCTFPVVE